MTLLGCLCPPPTNAAPLCDHLTAPGKFSGQAQTVRRLLLSALLTLSPVLAQTTPTALPAPGVKGVALAINRAQRSVTAYLPDLQNPLLAQALKDTANADIQVNVLSPRQAHIIRRSYLLSVALAAAQLPPAPLSYRFAEFNSPAFVVVDGVAVYYGPGLVDGTSSVTKGDAAFLKYALKVSSLAFTQAPVSPVLLFQERYGGTGK